MIRKGGGEGPVPPFPEQFPKFFLNASFAMCSGLYEKKEEEAERYIRHFTWLARSKRNCINIFTFFF